MTFEEKMKRLEEIIDLINNGSVNSLEDSIKYYDEGQRLIEELKAELKNAQEKIINTNK